MPKSIGFFIASCFVVGVLIAYLRSRRPVGPTSGSRPSAPSRFLGYVGGCAAGFVGLYSPTWLEGSSALQDRFTFVVLFFVLALGLCGALAGSLIAAAAAAQPSTRTFWLTPVQGFAATLIPAWMCTTSGISLGFPLFALLLVTLAFASAGACWFVYWACARLFAGGRSSAA